MSEAVISSIRTDEEYAALQSAFGEVVDLLGSALRKMAHLYESEYDADAPFQRPDWLERALQSLEMSEQAHAAIAKATNPTS
jgi:hypothetical protein